MLTPERDAYTQENHVSRFPPPPRPRRKTARLIAPLPGDGGATDDSFWFYPAPIRRKTGELVMALPGSDSQSSPPAAPAVASLVQCSSARPAVVLPPPLPPPPSVKTREDSGLLELRRLAAGLAERVAALPAAPADVIFTAITPPSVAVPRRAHALTRWHWALLGIGLVLLGLALGLITTASVRSWRRNAPVVAPVAAAATSPARPAQGPATVASTVGATQATLALTSSQPRVLNHDLAAPRVHAGAMATPPRPVKAGSSAPKTPDAATLDTILAGVSTATVPVGRPVAPGPQRLSKQEVQAGMQSLRTEIARCQARFHGNGTAMVRTLIRPSGAVGAAEVVGAMTDTPVAGCIEHSVRNLHFKSFSGPPLHVMYPFILH